jgi:hypothetical protein
MSGNTKLDFKNIPILIIARDRLTCLKQQVEAFEKRGYTNIIIVDNASSYVPLLEYYVTIPHRVMRMDRNYGHTVLIDQGILREFAHDFYAYTDPDIVPVEECPDNFMEHFYHILMRNRQVTKVGFGLKIDDLPEHFVHRDTVVGWEKQYWTNQMEPGVWLAPIDTTFALCRPGITPIVWQWAGRTDSPYVARHTPWYVDSNDLSFEDKYYAEHLEAAETNWSHLNR